MSNEVIAYQERIGALSIVDVKSQVNLIQQRKGGIRRWMGLLQEKGWLRCEVS